MKRYHLWFDFMMAALVAASMLCVSPILYGCSKEDDKDPQETPQRPSADTSTNNEPSGGENPGNNGGNQNGDNTGSGSNSDNSGNSDENGSGNGDGNGDDDTIQSPIVGFWIDKNENLKYNFTKDGYFVAFLWDSDTTSWKKEKEGSYGYNELARWLTLSIDNGSMVWLEEYRCKISEDSMTLTSMEGESIVFTKTDS